MAKKILVIDDEPDILHLVSHGLRKRGYEVFTGKDAQEALALAPKLMPDFIILDFHLPGMNGNEIARIFKNDEKLKSIPVILVSSMIADLSEKTAACGAESCLSKPFIFEQLINLIKKYSGPDQPAV
jgi:CheY-like chemotaxis protein